MQRIRLTFSRSQPLRYTGHLDMQIVWERTFRRARLPLMYSQGFHPQPKINQACPLPLGMISRMEVLDFWLQPDVPLDEISPALLPALPPGIEIINLAEEDLRTPALQTQVTSTIYQATFLIPFSADLLDQSVFTFLASPQILRVRRNKPYDLRPLVHNLEVLQTSNPLNPHLQMHLAARDGATGRPEEVISALAYDPLDTRFERMQLLFGEQ